MLICAVFFAGCPANGIKPELYKDSISAASQEVNTSEEDSLVGLFKLDKTKLRASDAAKKIAGAKNFALGDFNVIEAEALAYDDEAGTFTLKVKVEENGKMAEKELYFDGFAHPYANIAPSLKAADFDFSDAMDHNTRMDIFIEKSNKNINTALKEFSFLDRVGELTMGNHSAYSLTAKLSDYEGKIKITPEYRVKYLKKGIDNEEESLIEKDYSHAFLPLIRKKLIRPYFSKEDVFRHLINKTDLSIINVSSGKFASMYYAFAKHLNVTPGSLINDAEIQKIMARYNKEGGQYKMEIDTALFQPKSTGIRADDYEGRLDLIYCIAEKEQIAEMLYPVDPSIKPVSVKRELSVKGFRQINQENINSVFKFSLKLKNTETAKKQWLSKVYKKHRFLYTADDKNTLVDVYIVDNPLVKNDKLPYHLEVNGKNPEEILAFNDVLFFSKSLSGEKLFVEHIFLDKEKDSDILKIRIKFLGSGDEIVIEERPE